MSTAETTATAAFSRSTGTASEAYEPSAPRRRALPACRRILQAVRARIESGELRAGDRIDSERRLAEARSVSLMTARRALKELENKGLLERRAGLGAFVAPPKVHFNRLLSFSEQLASRGAPSSSRIGGRQSTAREPEAAARLGLAPETALLKLERIRLGGGEPLALETAYLSHDACSGAADSRTARLLAIPHGSPVLRIRQVTCSENGQRILYDLGLYRSGRHSLTVRRFR